MIQLVTVGSFLSKELQKHYSRQGNRIVFTNGLSLNQLSLEMWERLKFREIDPSVVSRVLKGERLFTQKQLTTFCLIVKISKAKKETLMNALHRDIYEKFQGRYLFDYKTNKIVEIAKNNLSLINKLNRKGSSSLVFNYACLTLEKLEKQLSTDPTGSLSDTLLSLIFDYLNQKSIAVLRSKMPKEAHRIIWTDLENMLLVAKKLSDSQKIGLAYAKMGDVLNLVGGCSLDRPALEKSTKYFKRAAELIEPDLLPYILGEQALNEAYMGNKSEFENLISKLYKVFPQSKPSLRCEGYSLIAKSKALLGISRGIEKDYIKAWDSYVEINKHSTTTSSLKSSSAFRKVQLTRSEIVATVYGCITRKPHNLKKLANDAIMTAKHFEYERYFNSMQHLIAQNREQLGFELAPIAYEE